jgi:hypothetical protein
MSTPVLNDSTLFQSGQIIPLSHVYELVGATDYLGKRKIHLFLNRNERFPEYEGREVCWRISGVEHGNTTDNDQTKSTDRLDATVPAGLARISTYVG